ncbi:condensation domain-containing protein, partial [Massilia aurea]
MMNLSDLIASLRAKSVNFSINGDKISFDAPAGVISADLLDQLRKHKSELLEYLMRTPQQEDVSLLPKTAPASAAQQRMWFLNRVGNSSQYNIRSLFRLQGSFELATFTDALNEIICRHEILRTFFTWENEVLVQHILPELSIPIIPHDAQHMDAVDRSDKVMEMAKVEADKPFDLEHAPLMRCSIFRLRPDEHLVHFTIHHIIADGWSMAVLIKEFVRTYAALMDTASAPLPPLTLQYSDFVRWQRQWLTEKRVSDQLAYWSAQLNGAPPLLDLPTDRPRPAVSLKNGAIIEMSVPSDLDFSLDLYSKDERTTVFMVFATALKILFARYTGQDDICIGTTVAGRTRAEFEPLIGLFLNTIVLRTRVVLDKTFSEVLREVRTNALNAYSNQDVPFEQVIEALNPARHPNHSPYFRVMLVLQNTPTAELKLPGLSMSPVKLQEAFAKFDLTINVREEEGRRVVQFQYNADLFDATTIDRLGRHLIAVLRAAAAADPLPIHDIQILSHSERHQLLAVFNDTAVPYPREHLLHQLFEEQAMRQPDGTAVV